MTARVWEELSRTLRTSAPYGAVRERLEAAAGSVDVVRLPVPAAAWIAGLVAEDPNRFQAVVERVLESASNSLGSP